MQRRRHGFAVLSTGAVLTLTAGCSSSTGVNAETVPPAPSATTVTMNASTGAIVTSSPTPPAPSSSSASPTAAVSSTSDAVKAHILADYANYVRAYVAAFETNDTTSEALHETTTGPLFRALIDAMTKNKGAGIVDRGTVTTAGVVSSIAKDGRTEEIQTVVTNAN